MTGKISISIFLLVIILFFSCKKENNNNSLVQADTLSLGQMKATIYGKSITFNIAKVQLTTTTTVNSVVISGRSNDSSKTISIVFNNTSLLQVQDYNLSVNDAGSNNYIIASIIFNNDSSNYICDGTQSKGNVVITKLTTSVISGLFNFIGVNKSDSTKKIKISGTFNTQYSIQKLANNQTIDANINNILRQFNVINAFSVNSGTASSIIIESRSTDNNSDYLIFTLKNIINFSNGIYNCQSGSNQVSATYYSTSTKNIFRCDGSSTSGNITFSSVSSSNVQGSFSFTGSNISGSSLNPVNISGQFNSNLKSSTIVSNGNMISNINGEQSLMTISNAVNYVSPNLQSIEIDGLNTNMDSVSFLLQRVLPLSSNVYEFENENTPSYILAYYSINGQTFPMTSKIGEAVLFAVTDKSITGAISFDCNDNNDASKIYTVNSEFNANLKTYNLAPESTFLTQNDILNASAANVSSTYIISGNDINGKLITSITFSNINISKSTYNCGIQALQKSNTIVFKYNSGNKKYICDGNKTNGEIRIESLSNSVITGFYSVNVYNSSNYNDIIHLTGSFNSPIK
jgi:hypothetical protein